MEDFIDIVLIKLGNDVTIVNINNNNSEVTSEDKVERLLTCLYKQYSRDNIKHIKISNEEYKGAVGNKEAALELFNRSN